MSRSSLLLVAISDLQITSWDILNYADVLVSQFTVCFRLQIQNYHLNNSSRSTVVHIEIFLFSKRTQQSNLENKSSCKVMFCHFRTTISVFKNSSNSSRFCLTNIWSLRTIYLLSFPNWRISLTQQMLFLNRCVCYWMVNSHMYGRRCVYALYTMVEAPLMLDQLRFCAIQPTSLNKCFINLYTSIQCVYWCYWTHFVEKRSTTVINPSIFTQYALDIVDEESTVYIFF